MLYKYFGTRNFSKKFSNLNLTANFKKLCLVFKKLCSAGQTVLLPELTSSIINKRKQVFALQFQSRLSHLWKFKLRKAAMKADFSKGLPGQVHFPPDISALVHLTLDQEWQFFWKILLQTMRRGFSRTQVFIVPPWIQNRHKWERAILVQWETSTSCLRLSALSYYHRQGTFS